MEREKTVGACDCCKYENVELTTYEVFFASFLAKTGVKEKKLCALCAGSMAGAAYEYKDQYPDSTVYGVICHVGNAVLAEIRKGTVLKPKAE